MFNVEGGFDIRTGIFTAGRSGTWRITASAYMKLSRLEIYRNEERITKFTTGGIGTEEGSYMGSRSLLMHLDTGDTVDLRMRWNPKDTYGFGEMEDILFCVESVQFDV